MSFDPEIHITHKDLAEHLGLTPSKLVGEILSFETPLERAGEANARGKHVTYYDRPEALAWAELWLRFDALERRARGVNAVGKPKAAQGPGQIVAPRTPTPFKPLQVDREMRIAYDRAQVQPPIITPNGYGDHARSWGGSRSEA